MRKNGSKDLDGNKKVSTFAPAFERECNAKRIIVTISFYPSDLNKIIS